MNLPPCANRDPRLFDSTRPKDHARARMDCAGCLFQADCLAEAERIAALHPTNPSRRGPTGTWGGLLWSRGRVVA